MKKTGYEFTRNWFDWAFENPDLNNTNMAALFLWFVEKNNRCGWAEKFSVTASESMDCLGMKSRNTYNKAFNDLVKHKFIIVVTRATNQNTCNVISLNQNLSKRKVGERSALDSAIIQHVSKREFGTCASSDTINKQVNNETANHKQKDTANAVSEFLAKDIHIAISRDEEIKEPSDFKKCVEFWLTEFHEGWVFSATDGKKLNSIIKKIKIVLADAGKSEDIVVDTFKAMCYKLPAWYKDKDLSIIDSKFNEIIQEIKNNKNGQTTKNNFGQFVSRHKR